MDLKVYIESGILEAYALGALPAADAAEVEAQVARHPDLGRELDALQEAIRKYAEAHSEAPAENLEARIWRAIEAGYHKQTASSQQTAQPAVVRPLPVASRPPASFSWARAAVLTGLLGSLALNLVLWNARQNGLERIAQLESRAEEQSTLFASRLSAQNRQLQAYALMKNLMGDPAVHAVKLQNLRPDADRSTVVFQNSKTGSAYLAVQKMPQLPQDKQYQLWVLEGGRPKGIGLFSGRANNAGDDADGMQIVPVAVARGEAFAISIEDIGGSLTPTADQIIMLGKVPA